MQTIPRNYTTFKPSLLWRLKGYPIGILYIDKRIDNQRPIYYGDEILARKYNLIIRFEDRCLYNEKLAYDVLIGYIKKKDFSIFQLAMTELYAELYSYKLRGYPSYKESCENFMKLVNSIDIRKELIKHDEQKFISV